MIRVAIADDHEIVRRGLRMTILGEEDMDLVGEAANGREAIRLAQSQRPDVLLLDIQMPEMDGLTAAAQIHAEQPEVNILILTSFDSDAKLYAALKAGVTGYLLKDTPGDGLVAAIRGAAQGIPQLHPEIARKLMGQMSAPATPLDDLSEREREVLTLVAQGKSNKEIGAALYLTETTVKGYVSTVLSKLHVTDRTQAALVAVRYGLVNIDDV
jgi:NarL family two-component system response regulator LiaR